MNTLAQKLRCRVEYHAEKVDEQSFRSTVVVEKMGEQGRNFQGQVTIGKKDADQSAAELGLAFLSLH